MPLAKLFQPDANGVRPTERLMNFLSRVYWKWQGEPDSIVGYSGPRPWRERMWKREDYHKLIAGYDQLLEKFGPRADIDLPKPIDNITISDEGAMARHDLFFQLSLRQYGETLESFGRVRLEDKAREQGEWVRDRFWDYMNKTVYGPRGPRWVRETRETNADGETVISIEHTQDEPANAFVADLSVLKPKAIDLKPIKPL